jgi:ribosome biogenesis GTPase
MNDRDYFWRARTRQVRRSGPRSKRRPKHQDALEGLVVSVDRGRYSLIVNDVRVVAVKARELGRDRIVVGDRVDVVGDTSGTQGTLARIVRIQPRRTVLHRTADDTDPVEREIVAGADQLVIVAALADPPFRPRMVDRLVTAGHVAGMEVLLVLTKADLVDTDTVAEITALYTPLGVGIEVTGQDDAGDIVGLDRLQDRLTDRVSVLVGHSGVGKSTLVNALVPDAERATGSVNVSTGRGRHTSSSAVALQTPSGDWVIDTPGVRSFGLGHVSDEDIVASFADLAEVTANCPRGCTHAEDSPDCELDVWLEKSEQTTLRAARVDSLRRLLAARN